MISAHSLTKHFDEVVAVDDLSFELAAGETLALLGPNGAGKTTTVRILACLVGSTSGEATVDGRRVGVDNQEIRRRVGLLTEAPGMYAGLTARQNLEFFASLYGISDVRRQVDKYLNLLELRHRHHDLVTTFSKGMKQKLALPRTVEEVLRRIAENPMMPEKPAPPVKRP